MSPDYRILLVEDEALIALELKDLLEDAHIEVVETALTVESALNLLTNSRANCALLDIDLDGTSSFPVADALAQRRVPFAFMTGYDNNDVPARHRDRPFIRKPFEPRALVELIRALVPKQTDVEVSGGPEMHATYR